MKALRLLVDGISNPLDHVLPDFAIFGAQFTLLWQKLLAGAWGLALVVAVVYLIAGIVEMGKATQTGNGQAHAIGRAKAGWAAASLGGLAALSVIVGAILWIFS